MKIIIIALTMTWLLSTASAQIVQTPSGPLEFIGLKQRSPQQLWDSIYARAPGEGAHACAGVLKSTFHYPDAEVAAYPDSDGFYWVVTLIEPEEAGRVQYRPRPDASQPTREDWRPIFTLFWEHGFLSQAAVSSYAYVLKGFQDSARMEVEQIDARVKKYVGEDDLSARYVDQVWEFFRKHAAMQDRDLALRTLADDGNDTNRFVALFILASFPDDDASWLALMNAQRDVGNLVWSRSTSVLNMFGRQFVRPVDWGPATESIRHILAGTNLGAFLPTIRILMGTGIQPNLASDLLRDNGDLLVAYLRASHPDEREEVHDFLKRMSGKDFGEDAAKWEQWIASLH